MAPPLAKRGRRPAAARATTPHRSCRARTNKKRSSRSKQQDQSLPLDREPARHFSPLINTDLTSEGTTLSLFHHPGQRAYLLHSEICTANLLLLYICVDLRSS